MWEVLSVIGEGFCCGWLIMALFCAPATQQMWFKAGTSLFRPVCQHSDTEAAFCITSCPGNPLCDAVQSLQCRDGCEPRQLWGTGPALVHGHCRSCYLHRFKEDTCEGNWFPGDKINRAMLFFNNILLVPYRMIYPLSRNKKIPGVWPWNGLVQANTSAVWFYFSWRSKVLKDNNGVV